MKTERLYPSLKKIVWGGQRLIGLYSYGGERLTKQFEENRTPSNIAESWVFSCHKKGRSTVIGGENDGKTLAELLEDAGPETLGTHYRGGEFPILIKFIDAKRDLSIQVHPDDAYAGEHHEGQYGKTECWYVLDAEKDAELIFGLDRELTREELAARGGKKEVMEVLRRVKVKRGDFIFIPSKTLHAICKGIYLAEVQQSSDITYRIYDYDRLDEDGKPREIQVPDAVAVSNLSPMDVSFQPMGKEERSEGYAKTLLTECEYFKVEKIETFGEYRGEADETSFVSLIVTGGEGLYRDADGEIYLREGDSLFIPANKGAFTVRGNAELLKTTI
ncbi:MAG: class I mannose-6-phosphate isomerase [Clostridia bacterium]|nr:class I mannose-6-phosphate isomerase [Clostridia bacterium]